MKVRTDTSNPVCYPSVVKTQLLIALALIAEPFLHAQATPAIPHDPKAILAIAAPLYDYASADMKPWHASYRYQFYDQDGKPAGEGKFNYWSQGTVSKMSWVRGDQSHLEWRTSDGKDLRSVTEKDVDGMERRLYFALLTSLVKIDGNQQLKYFTTKYHSKDLPCIGAAKPSKGPPQPDSLETVWPSYCFADTQLVLVASHENGTITNVYGEIRKFQNHYVPGRIEVAYVGKKRVDAELEDLSQVQADDAAFTPSPEAKEFVAPAPVVVPILKAPSLVLTKKVDPIYPPGAHANNISGTVIIAAIVDKDGKVKNASVVSSPDSELSAAALDAVRQWRYQPPALGGQAAEIHTTISINFAP